MEHIDEEWEFLTSFIKGLALHFGNNCECVLLDVSNYEEYGSGLIVAIENGHVTGRKVGDTGTNLGLEILKGKINEGDKYNYMTQTADGKMLRSTTMYIRNSKGIPIGCICINLDITDLIMADKTIQDMLLLEESSKDVNEVFANNINDLLNMLIQQAQDYVQKPVAKMTREDKKKGIEYLDEKGAFLVKKSGERICNYFNISKYTLYKYLDELKQESNNKK
ncbi:transcriptional regulator [Virgibacillus sp. NKC19-3]|uniref:helix-turn-helix transcriptional regulator n=1 Tax=Virgibacillus saliphilus TaxID=2831674 RepID=UPI001C9AE330|nr:helix-turn-helix transcriptional regulator [Virgibacillus sp. NKC19-3]MBY7141761.1 transcriptional regulator [Virgibacillus sp. NKC19-3]